MYNVVMVVYLFSLHTVMVLYVQYTATRREYSSDEHRSSDDHVQHSSLGDQIQAPFSQ